MKSIVQFNITVLIIVIGGFFNRAGAQQLASEKPVVSFYSKTTKQKLESKANASQPAAKKSRQLASEKTWPQPSVPPGIKVTPVTPKQPRASTGRRQTASEKPLDMDKINRQRERGKRKLSNVKMR